jgi:hypothetical protein
MDVDQPGHRVSLARATGITPVGNNTVLADSELSGQGGNDSEGLRWVDRCARRDTRAAQARGTPAMLGEGGMGRKTTAEGWEEQARDRYGTQLRRCLDALATMLRDGRFSAGEHSIGLELELNLVDGSMGPSMSNDLVCARAGNPALTTELGQHNLEINLPPRPLSGPSLSGWESELTDLLRGAEAAAAAQGATVVLIGILPTIAGEDLDPRWLSSGRRYAELNERIMAARGEAMALDVRGLALAHERPGAGEVPDVPDREERLAHRAMSIAPEAACTSAQLHLRVAPDEFAAHWNAAQCLAGPKLATAVNSPFLMRKALWQETRIPLFQQATDPRPVDSREAGKYPRVWFGQRWISSVFELFDENVRYFPGLLAETSAQDPFAELDAGHAPALAELCLLNGTVWRWNRPVYDVVDDSPHVRVENRVLPAGPTVIDMLANAAFFYGALGALARDPQPVWDRMPFEQAAGNFYAAARNGLTTTQFWPGLGWVPASELILRELLPAAREGLAAYGVPRDLRERYLGVIEGRCRTGRTGARWQRDTVAALEGAGMPRDEALARMLERYTELMRSGRAVHTWPRPCARLT